MNRSDYLFTSESVTEGHPDKLADRISDAVLDEIIKRDPAARVACETLVTTGLVLISGEITTDCYVDIPKVARETICQVGYTRAKYGFDCNTCAILTSIDEQSQDIALGVDEALEKKKGDFHEEVLGAGDQGMMFGYASDETREYMPMPITLAHSLVKRLALVRKEGILDFLRPDGKSQVTVEYRDHKPYRVATIILSTQHHPKVEMKVLEEALLQEVISEAIPEDLLDSETELLVNPTGRFVIGGPQGDTGLTGRKIIVDTYGGMGHHGGGCFSGKDPTKVDRSASYAARYVAKNLVAAGVASRCEIQLAYAIGVANPVAIAVDTFGTSKVKEERIESIVRDLFDLRPGRIIEDMNLRVPIYTPLSSYGHFGREGLDLPWERLDKVDAIQDLL